MRFGVALFILALALPVFAVQDLNLKISTDKAVYAPGESVRVSGILFDNLTPVPSAPISASLLSESGSTAYSSNSTTTSLNGTYFIFILAPSSGSYKILVAANSTSSTTGFIGLKVAQSANFKIELARPVYSPGGNVSVSVYVRDSLGSALSSVSVNATLINSTGGSLGAVGVLYSDSDGKAAFSFPAPNSTGYYTFIVNGLFSQSFTVASFQVHAYITNGKGDSAWSFAQNDNVTINAVVTDSSGNPYSASVSAVVTSPPPTVTVAVTNFTNTSAGKYRDVYVAGAQEGTYSVKVTATSGTTSAETYTKFQVSNLYVVVERIEGVEGSVTPNASYSALVTVRDATGSLKSNATLTAKFSNSIGETLSTFSGAEDTASHIYTLSLSSPSETGTFDFTITAAADGKTATWANRVQVSSIKAILSTDKFTYSTGDTVGVTVETKPAITVTNLSYEVWGPNGIVSSGSNFSQSVNGTATFFFTAPRSNGFYSLNAKVNGVVGVHSGFEVKKYMMWIDTRNGSSSYSTWQQIFPTGALVYLHINFQDPSGQYINITSSASNFSYSLNRLYSHSENKEYSGAANFSSVYEGASSTVAVVYINTSALIAGDYGVELVVKDKNGNSETAYGGFRLGGFNVLAYPTSWQYSSSDNVNISVEVRAFNGSAISGATVTFLSSEQAEKWPFVADVLSSGSVTSGTTGADGRTSLLLKSTWVFGFHNVRIQAENDGTRQEAFAGFVVRGFSLTGTIDAGESLYPGQNYTLTASAQDSSGTAMSNVNVTLIEVRSEKNWNLVDTPNDNLGLTDSGGSKSKTRSVPSSRQQGNYVLILKGEKNGEVVYSNVRYAIKSYDVKFQSGKSGQYEEWFWAGMKQPGNTIDIPTKVTRGGTAVPGANLSIVKLVRMDVWPNTELSTTSNSTATSSGGTATVSYLLPSSLASGEYALILNVNASGSSSLTDPWRSPRVLVRTYEVFMDLQKDNRFIWSTMADENVSVVFNVRYPQNFTGVNGVNVSLLELRNNDDTLFRNLSNIQNGLYPNNRTGVDGIAAIPLTTPNRTGTFIIVGRAGTEEFRRWFDVTSFTASVDMGSAYEFALNGNISFVAHAKDGSGRDISGVSVNVSGVWNNWDWTPLSTFVPQNMTTGSNGASFRFTPNSAGLTTPGDFSARITFTSGSAVTEFWVWFRLKNFDVKVYPTQQLQVGQPINFTVETIPYTPGITAKIIRLRSAKDWNIIADYSAIANFSGITDSNGRTTVLGPALERGEYVAEFNITNAPPFFAWFEIRSFTVNAWMDQWAYQTGQNVSVRVCINPPSNATVNYTAYGPLSTQTGNFSVVTGDNSCSNGKQISGITSPGGSYKLRLTIFDPTTPERFEERWLWYEARTYDAWVWFDRWQMSPTDNVVAHANVRLGRNAVSGLNVTLGSIGYERDYNENDTPSSNLGFTIAVKGHSFEGMPSVMLNISGVLVRVNSSPSESYITPDGNNTIQVFGVFDNGGGASARIRVERKIRNANGGNYTNATNSNGEATLSFPLIIAGTPSQGSYSARFSLVGGQDVTPWFEVIPFSYRAYLSQGGGAAVKFLTGGTNASIIVNTSSVESLNVSLIGLMRNGWEPVSGIVPSNDSRLSINGSLSLGANSVRLVSISCPPGQQTDGMMFEPCRANLTVNASGNVQSIEAWPFWMVNYPGMILNVREIRGDFADVSLLNPVTQTMNATHLANFSFNVPNQQGGYSVNLLVQKGEISAYDSLWFSIDNVNAWGWAEKWQYNTGENITIIAQVQRGPNPAQGYVANVTSLRYRTDFSPDQTDIPQYGVNATTGSDGMARIRIPPQDGGEYEARISVFHPSNPSVMVNFSQWFRVRSFDVWMYTPGDWAAYLGENMTFIVETNPKQENASVKMFEYAFGLVPEASVEIKQTQGWDHDSTSIQNGSNSSLFGIDITLLGSTKICEIGPNMDFSSAAESATLNVSNGTFAEIAVLSGRNPMGDPMDPNSAPAPLNVSRNGQLYELRVNDVHCRPINEKYFNIANGTTDQYGRATLTFNTSRLNNTISTEHPLSVNVTTLSGYTARGMGGFMLKPFDIEAWFDMLSNAMEPSFLPGEIIPIKVRVTNHGVAMPNVSIFQNSFGYCPESSGSTPAMGGGGMPLDGGEQGPSPSGGMAISQCNFTRTQASPLGFTDSSGLFNFTFTNASQQGSYDLEILGDAAGKKSFSKLRFNLVSFSVSLDTQQADAGSPITVSISSNLPNVSSVAQVEDHTQPWNNTSNSFPFRTVAAGTLNSTGGGTLVINTTGLSGFYNMRVVLNTTKTASSSFEVTAYSLSVTTDKGVYLPGENITVTMRATRGNFPLPSVGITRFDWFDELNWNTPSGFQNIFGQSTNQQGILTYSIMAPATPSDWSLKVESNYMGSQPVRNWASFTVSSFILSANASNSIIDPGIPPIVVNFTVTIGNNSQIPLDANVSIAFVRSIDPVNKITRIGNFSAPYSACRSTQQANKTLTFSCSNFSQPGGYDGIVVLSRQAVTDFSNIQNALAIGPLPSVWVKKNASTTVTYPATASGSSPRVSYSINAIVNATALYIPFVIESPKPFPESFNDVIMGLSTARQVNRFVNYTNISIPIQTPDVGGRMYYLTFFTDIDMSLSELVGSQTVPGDLKHLMDIRENFVDITQANASIRITTPSNNSVVPRNFPVQAMMGGNLTGVFGMRGNLPGKGEFPFEGSQFWQNMTNGTHTLEIWLVNSSGGRITGSQALDRVTFTVNP